MDNKREENSIPNCQTPSCSNQTALLVTKPLKLCEQCCNTIAPKSLPTGRCSYPLGCTRYQYKIGKIPIGLCYDHIQYLITMAALPGKRDILKQESISVKEDSQTCKALSCKYIYREAGRGYKALDKCTMSIRNGSYCPAHIHEMNALDSTLIILKSNMTWYMSSDIYKKSVSRSTSRNVSRAVTPKKSKVTHNINIKLSREELCRLYIERLTGKKFPKASPSWLVHRSTGRRLQLDGYCEELKIAFEHDGEQHYTYPNTWHKTEKEYEESCERDKLKNLYCKENGVKLIRIRASIAEDKIEEYIEKQLKSKRH